MRSKPNEAKSGYGDVKKLLTILALAGLAGCTAPGTSEETAGDVEDDLVTIDTTADAELGDETVDPKGPLPLLVYENERFDYCFAYPDRYFVKRDESRNNDGVELYAPTTDVWLRAYGRHALGETLQESLARDRERAEVMTAEMQNGWYEVKLREGDRLTYLRTYLVGEDFHTVEFDYPEVEERRLQPVMDEVLATFPGCE